ncbi:unnamed protein product, partial [Protopolystoma xenopodis]
MIYKSTKCNDVLNSGYCPRGPFCAFAHSDAEMNIGHEFQHTLMASPPGSLVPTMASAVSPGSVNSSNGSLATNSSGLTSISAACTSSPPRSGCPSVGTVNN